MSTPIPATIKADVDEILREHGDRAMTMRPWPQPTPTRPGQSGDEVLGQWSHPQLWPRPGRWTRETNTLSPDHEHRPIVKTFPAPDSALAIKLTERRRRGYAHALDSTLEGLGTSGCDGLESPAYVRNRCAADRHLVGLSRHWSARHWWRQAYPRAWYVPEARDYREGLMFLDDASPAGHALTRIDRAVALCMRRKLEHEYHAGARPSGRKLFRSDFREPSDRTVSELLIWRDRAAATLAACDARAADELPHPTLAQLTDLEDTLATHSYRPTT